MISSLKSEFRKFLSIRSTYIISILALALLGFVTFYAMGHSATPGSFGSTAVMQASLDMIMLVSAFTGIAAILLICHEYRYNTIAYTLTMTNRRLKVLFSKLIVITIYGIIMAALALLLTAVLLPLGAKSAGIDAVPQDYDFYSVIWKVLVYMTLSNAMALLFGFLFRNLVFTIAVYFILPSTIEPLLNGLLKVSTNYLPNSASTQILASNIYGPVPGQFSPLASAGVVLLYLAVGWIIAAVLFVRRDAN